MPPNPDLRFATPGVLAHDGERLVCGVCGDSYRNLAQHARRAHGLPADAYRELAGLNRQTRLVSDEMRARLRVTTAPTIARLRAAGKLRNWGEDTERLARDKTAAIDVLHGGLRREGRQSRRASWTDEQRRAVGERTAARNRAGDLRASPAAIGRGVRAALARDPDYLASSQSRMRDQAAAARRLTDEQIAEAAQRYRAGEYLREIASSMRVAKNTVRRWLLVAGVSMRPRGQRR